MTFEDIPIKMMQLGVNRAWLAEQCHYSISTIANILAAGGNPAAKTPKALRRISQELEREEKRQIEDGNTTLDTPYRVVLEPDKERFDRWMKAVYSQPGRNFDEWAKAGLDAIANNELLKSFVAYPSSEDTSMVAEEETPYKAKNLSS